ncbi:glycosyl hydrolase [Microcella sp.]|uniref:glycosyl hydrolase n=1 Tax=Microcella sp. TaxID=1913979 RepID=UPI00391B4100
MIARRARAGVTLAGSLALVAVVSVISGCSAVNPAAPDLPGSEPGTVLLDAEVGPLLAAVPERSVAEAPTMRLAEGLVPPTNRWFSGLVFGDEPQPVFPLPLSFRLQASGFAFGVPTVTSSPALIAAAAVDHVTVETEATSALVSAYDEVSVTVALQRDDERLAEVSIAPGSPMVGYRAVVAHDVDLGAAVARTELDGVWSSTVQGAEYGLIAPEGELGGEGRILSLPQGATATWVAVPAGVELSELVPHASSPLLGVEVAYAVDEDRASTVLNYRTADGTPTLVGSLPHQSDALPAADAVCELGTFATVSGEMTLCAAPALAFAVPATAPTTVEGLSGLDLAGLDDADRAELVSVLSLEAGTLPDLPADTYFGGKALARIATLLSLARGLDQPVIAEALHEPLMTELRTWIEPAGCATRDDRCFVYDPALRGMVGLVPSFGSEEFNDHHFHYGSFIYAAAIAAQGDEALVAELRPMISLLAADVASSGGELFPTRRAFDPYAGHSWASGYSPFADGNNQESSSEAVAAHHALALWGAVAGDAALEDEARWMLALESHAALTSYTAFDASAEIYAGYDHGVVGIVWDGKRDYATWFSAEPAAILGIQLLPMRPGTEGSLAAGSERILSNIAEATASGPSPQFADYLLMYQALAGPEQAELALEAARALPYSSIDDGNSRSYLLAFIMVQR